MTDRLKNILHFTAIPASNTVSLPHGLLLSSRPLVPDFLDPNPKGLTVSADDVNVTVTNTTPDPVDVEVLCEAWHTIERAFGSSATQALTPQPFVSGGGVGGGDGSTPAVVFDDSVPGTNSNIRENRALNRSPIDNTQSQITNLGSQDGAFNPSATGATAIGATIGGGDDNTAQGAYSVVPGGIANTASGFCSVAEGDGTTSNGDGSHSEGNATVANSDFTHAEGTNTTAQGTASHAEGDTTTANGDASHAEGAATIAGGQASHAEGAACATSADYAHAEGRFSTASGTGSHSEGISTTASGNAAHAEGDSCIASGDFSHAEGNTAAATRFGQHAHSSVNGGPAAGFSQQSVITQFGTLTSSGMGSSTELDPSQPFELEDNKAYTIVVTAIFKKTGALVAQSFKQTFCARRAGGTSVIAGSGVQEQIGDAAAATWALAASIGAAPDRFKLTISNGATTDSFHVTAKIEFVEILNA